MLTISVFEALDSSAGGFDARSLWLHSLAVATAARELATEVRCPDTGACFTAGLLHDMGKIALAKLEPLKFAQAIALTQDGAVSTAEAERRLELPPHDLLGSRLAKQWRFPATLSTPIEHHHSIHRTDVRDRLAPNLRSIAEIVSIADVVASRVSEAVRRPAPAPPTPTPAAATRRPSATASCSSATAWGRRSSTRCATARSESWSGRRCSCRC